MALRNNAFLRTILTSAMAVALTTSQTETQLATKPRREVGPAVPPDTSCQPPPIPGDLPSQTGAYVAGVSMGEAGLRHLEVRTRSGRVLLAITDDISGLLWIPDEAGLLYAVSPVYGVPGVYAFDRHLGTVRRVVRPTSLGDRNYPDGADFFTLCAVRGVSAGRYAVVYVRSSHVDSSRIGDGLQKGALRTDTLSLP